MDEWRAEVNLIRKVKHENEGDSKVDRKKVFGTRFLANGPDSDPELRDEDEAVENKATPGANHARLRGIRKLV
jgi:hypothetical protein